MKKIYLFDLDSTITCGEILPTIAQKIGKEKEMQEMTNNCMNNDIPYYSTISRESIVKRIKAYAGETYSFEEFVANDSREAGVGTSRFSTSPFMEANVRSFQMHPQIHEGSPLK